MQGQISGRGPHGQNSHVDRSGGFGRAGLDQKSALHTSVFKDNLALVVGVRENAAQQSQILLLTITRLLAVFVL